MTTERFTRNDNVRFCSGLSVVVGAASHAAWRGRQDCPHPALSQRARERRTRQLLAPPHGACGRGCAPVPKPMWGRGLSERSEFRSLSPHFSPASCYGRRSTRCAGAYSRKPLRHSVQLCLQRLAVRAPQHNGVSTPSRRSLVRNVGSPSGPGQRNPKGHARAPMVLGPFAETKGPRRAGPKPRKPLPPRRAGTTPRILPLGARGRNPACFRKGPLNAPSRRELYI